MVSPRMQDAAERQFQEETGDLEDRLWATYEVRLVTEARLREREQDSYCKGLRYNLVTADGERRCGDDRGDRCRALGGARGPRVAVNYLDY